MTIGLDRWVSQATSLVVYKAKLYDMKLSDVI